MQRLTELIKMNPAGLAEIRSKVTCPVCASETLATHPIFRDLLERRAIDIVMLHLSWVGGISEGKKIATMGTRRSSAPRRCSKADMPCPWPAQASAPSL
jgi:L-alanine-DL-glutamate epimerase-like enolase superfamily enzyme